MRALAPVVAVPAANEFFRSLFSRAARRRESGALATLTLSVHYEIASETFVKQCKNQRRAAGAHLTDRISITPFEYR